MVLGSSPVAVTSPSNFAPASSKEFLDIHTTIKCGFTLKCVCDMTRTYSQMHCTDKYSEHSSIIWTVWPNGWVFVYELSGSEFESSCSHYNYHFANHLFVIIIIINYHQYYLLVILFLFTSCFTIFKAFTNSFFAFLIIQFFLGTKMKIRHSLVLCYPSHLAFAFYYQWFKSLSALTIIVN